MYGSGACVNKDLVARVHARYPGQLVIRRNGSPVKPREFIVCPGFAPENRLGVYLHNVDAVVSAFSERFFYIKINGLYVEPPQPIVGCYRRPNFVEFRRLVLSHISRNFPTMSRDATVAAFRGLKRRRYEQARCLVLRDGLQVRDSHLKAFCKFSKVEVGDPARVISPRDPKWNLELAMYVKHLEHKMYSSIHKVFTSTFPCGSRLSKYTVMKGLDCDEVALDLRRKWDTFTNPVAIMLDVSKLDACLGIVATRYEHSFYTGVYPRARKLRWMLKCMRKHRVHAYCPDGDVVVKCPGRKASGDVTTALGDILVVTSLYYDLACRIGCVFELADMGDDACVILERSDLATFLHCVVDVFMEGGFYIKVDKIVHVFEEIVFCQQHPINIGCSWRMVREPTTVVTKDVMCLLHCQNEKVFRKWLGAVALAGLHLTDGVPVLSHFYQCLLRSGRDPGNKLFNKLMEHTYFVRRKVSSSSKIDDAARVSFYYATGLLPDAQLELETRLDNYVIDRLATDVIDFSQLSNFRGTQLSLLYL